MNIKQTKIFAKLRLLKDKRIIRKRYLSCVKMNECDYEDYLSKLFKEKMLFFDYTKEFATGVDFSNPKTYCEKVQWLKLYDQDPRKTTFTDKYEVRNHISDVIGAEYLVPLISIDGKDCFLSPNEIDFNKLPNQFVLKCTHGSHMNIIVRNKSILSSRDIKSIKRKLSYWLKINYAFLGGLELHYKDIKPRIIIEKYLDFDGSLPDYKFYCFNSEPRFMSKHENRGTDKYTETYFDLNGNRLPFCLGFNNINNNNTELPKFQEMIALSKKLCSDFLFVRVDFYVFRDKIYFGELTFSSASGYEFPKPYMYTKELDNLILIDQSIREKETRYRK